MEKLQFNIDINAPREKVWKTLFEDETYRQWTSAFSENSSAETDWKKGSKILFLDGTGSGMVSKVAESIPNEYMSIEHLGMLKDGVEDLHSDDVKAWAGAHENYTLKGDNGKTELFIESDITEEYKEMMTNIWPKALNKLKELAEQ